jgi:hypothetical protein
LGFLCDVFTARAIDRIGCCHVITTGSRLRTERTNAGSKVQNSAGPKDTIFELEVRAVFVKCPSEIPFRGFSIIPRLSKAGCPRRQPAG